MPSLTIRFATRMHKRVAGSEGKATPSSDGKRMKRSSPGEGAQKDWAIVSVDCPD